MKFRAEDMMEMAARRSTADWIWGGLGLTTATVSAGFATYMAVIGPASFGQPHEPQFGLFASLARMSPLERRAAQILHGPSPSSQAAKAQDSPAPAVVAGGPVDFAPTGTVGETADDRRVEPNGAAHPAAGAASLPGYILRDVFDGKALVESRTALALVAPGSKLDGAGQVESIERQGDVWVVKTTHGIISTPAH